jgi:hypothetical protein
VAPLDESFGEIPYIQEKKPNPRHMELFVNQSVVTIENKDFCTMQDLAGARRGYHLRG